MRVGLITPLHGLPDGDTPAPSWDSVSGLASAAEAVGFDMFVFEDALLYRGETNAYGVWESVSIAAGIAATTSRISLGQSVVNSPYRSPAMVASIATTLDEISGGRYVLGIGAGNTPDSDYEGFGFPTDKRYSRFAEAIQIIHALLKEGAIDFEGEFYSAKQAQLVLRGPRDQGPPINIAAIGPKMMKLTARYGDAWNGSVWDETLDEANPRLKGMIQLLEQALDGEGRGPLSVMRTLDFYTVVPEGFNHKDAEGFNMQNPLTGTAEQIADQILSFTELGFQEVRLDLFPKTAQAIEAMKPVVDLVHAGRT